MVLYERNLLNTSTCASVRPSC